MGFYPLVIRMKMTTNGEENIVIYKVKTVNSGHPLQFILSRGSDRTFLIKNTYSRHHRIANILYSRHLTADTLLWTLSRGSDRTFFIEKLDIADTSI